MAKVLILSYAGCSTCKKALRWLANNRVDAEVRPIVEAPPSVAELKDWVAQSGRPVRKWLNTSGQSYRALKRDLGKARVDAAEDDEILRWLTQDGKLIKRPVLIAKKNVLDAPSVVVGFDEAAYRELFR